MFTFAQLWLVRPDFGWLCNPGSNVFAASLRRPDRCPFDKNHPQLPFRDLATRRRCAHCAINGIAGNCRRIVESSSKPDMRGICRLETKRSGRPVSISSRADTPSQAVRADWIERDSRLQIGPLPLSLSRFRRRRLSSLVCRSRLL